MIYLDHAASTPVFSEALDLLCESYAQDFANPSAKHSLGRELAKKLEGARERLKALIQSPSQDQLLFVSSATEANNLLVKSFELKEDEILFVSEGDHPSLFAPTNFLRGIKKKLPAALESDDKVRLILLSHVNNHSGELLDLEVLCRELKKCYPKAHIHVDASQSFTKFELSCAKMAFDSLALSAQKMGGPRGIGALWFKKNVKLKALFEGGGQEFNLRPSTEALPLILSFVKAAELALTKRQEYSERVTELNKTLVSTLSSLSGILFPFKNCSPYILTFIVPGISSDILLRLLEEKKIYLSSSSACSSRIKGHSEVFSALGIESRFHKNVLRLSLGRTNTPEEIEAFLEIFKAILLDLSFLKK